MLLFLRFPLCVKSIDYKISFRWLLLKTCLSSICISTKYCIIDGQTISYNTIYNLQFAFKILICVCRAQRSYKTTVIEFFSEDRERLKVFNYFRDKPPL